MYVLLKLFCTQPDLDLAKQKLVLDSRVNCHIVIHRDCRPLEGSQRTLIDLAPCQILTQLNTYCPDIEKPEQL